MKQEEPFTLKLPTQYLHKEMQHDGFAHHAALPVITSNLKRYSILLSFFTGLI